MLASVPANQLPATILFLSTLPKLEDVTITCKTFPAISLDVTSLSNVMSSLKSLSLTSGCCGKMYNARKELSLPCRCCMKACSVDETSEEEEEYEKKHKRLQRRCGVSVESLMVLLRPWQLSLERLHLDHCNVSFLDASMPGSPGLFSKFPRLHTLRLMYLNTTSSPAPSILNLTGCSALQILDCSSSSMQSLNCSGCCILESLTCQRSDIHMLTLTGCRGLVMIDCQHNQLTAIVLTGCVLLKQLHCGHNELDYIMLDQSANLDNLTCSGHHHPSMIAGWPSVLNLECNAVTFTMVDWGMRNHLLRLSLRHSFVSEQLFGFKDLKYLRCKFEEGGDGLVFLDRCTSVELDCQCAGRRLPITARNKIHKMKLKQLGGWTPDLYGFTRLRELHLTLHCQTSLDLSVCSALRKLKLAMILNKNCPSFSLDLTGCCFLKEMVCNGFSGLLELDVSSCVNLVYLSCKESGLESLDTSLCPLLRSIDISQSKRLQSITTNGRNHLLVIRSEGCQNLLITPAVPAENQGVPDKPHCIDATDVPEGRVACGDESQHRFWKWICCLWR